ncbi:energy transducer TonB [Caldimonas sp. KR1-144]|uniref:energy transducer TonB n=1 Tax=Caldimonas sp. KR1-144 TaxID=3400911 RepID=UPI003C08C293
MSRPAFAPLDPHPAALALPRQRHPALMLAIVAGHAALVAALVLAVNRIPAVAAPVKTFVALLPAPELPRPPDPPQQPPQPRKTVRAVAAPTPPQAQVPPPEVTIAEAPPPPIAVEVAPPAPAPAPPPAPPAEPAPAAPRVLPVTAVRYLVPPAPTYPLLSKRMNEVGTVVVKILVDEKGRPRDALVAESSGFARLDEAARLAALAARFVPYVEQGVAHAVWVLAPIQFSLGRSS